jgi:formylglycine-generating enzyme required for sulfatase activity
MLLLSTEVAGGACTSDRCTDTQVVASFRASVAGECSCASTPSPKRYRTCVKSHIKSAVRAGTLPATCKKPIFRCEADSTCGLREAVACCRVGKTGHVKARIVKSAADCRGTACASARSVRDACTGEAACLSDYDGVRAGDGRRIAGIELSWCPPGSFTMGSPADEPERRPDERQVQVTLTRGFWIAKYEATQGDFKRVMGSLPGDPTAQLPEGDRYPVGNVNFAEAESYAAALTRLGRDSGELPPDWEFRLPTEAQWEYAARAGTTTATAFGSSLTSSQANFAGRSYNTAEQGPALGHAVPVGGYPPNAWGIHDMHGNTFEWCRDWYHQALPGGVDPDLHDASDGATRNSDGSISRSRRGGSWGDDGWACRSASRLRFEPERRYDHIGFRVVVVRP